ncbi:MAG: HD domain-containing protein, partial [Anaerolineae bacterium]
MGRLGQIRAYADSVIASIQEAGRRPRAGAHLGAVSDACVRIAEARSLDAELAAACGILHDIYLVRTAIDAWHAHSGAEMARPWLRDMGGFSAEEQLLILSAIHHHGDLAHVHDAYDELLKDAVVLTPFLADPGQGAYAHSLRRLNRVSRELGLPIGPLSLATGQPPRTAAFCAANLACIAESLARAGIEGTRTDSRFAEILHYWPEETAYNELRSNWCAAFVYHCCTQAGLALPIRHPLSSCRFAAVAAWFQWANLVH